MLYLSSRVRPCKIFNLNNGFIQSGSTISLTSSQLGKCLDLKDNGDLRQIEFEHRGDDNWCFGGVVVTLDNGEKYSCEEDDYPFSINYMKSSTCRPTKGKSVGRIITVYY